MSSQWREGTWQNGKKILKSYWVYNWASDAFTVELNSVDRITGGRRRFVVKGEDPEWGNWKLLKEKKKCQTQRLG